MHNELAVEGIIRKRSIEGTVESLDAYIYVAHVIKQAFHSRCQYFNPPLSDVQARQMWDSVQK